MLGANALAIGNVMILGLLEHRQEFVRKLRVAACILELRDDFELTLDEPLTRDDMSFRYGKFFEQGVTIHAPA